MDLHLVDDNHVGGVENKAGSFLHLLLGGSFFFFLVARSHKVFQSGGINHCQNLPNCVKQETSLPFNQVYSNKNFGLALAKFGRVRQNLFLLNS